MYSYHGPLLGETTSPTPSFSMKSLLFTAKLDVEPTMCSFPDIHVFITPRACARGKVIGCVVVVVVVVVVIVSTKIAISRDVGV